MDTEGENYKYPIIKKIAKFYPIIFDFDAVFFFGVMAKRVCVYILLMLKC